MSTVSAVSASAPVDTFIASSAHLRQSSSGRRSSPSRFRHNRIRSANNVSVNPATPEVISNLLASFSSITFSGDSMRPGSSSKTLEILPHTPVRNPLQKTSSPSSASRAGDLSLDFTECKHPSSRSINLLPPHDAAEFPVIRTARPPSGYSKSIAKKVPLRERLSFERSNRSAPPTSYRVPRQSHDEMGPLRNIEEEKRQAGAWSTRRISVEAMKSGSQLGSFVLQATPEGSEKGKERKVTRLPLSMSRPSSHPRSPPPEESYPPATPPPIPRGQSFRLRIDDRDLPVDLAGPSRNTGIAKETLDTDSSLSQVDFKEIRSSVHVHAVIPARKSSLRHSDELPSKKQVSAARRDRGSTEGRYEEISPSVPRTSSSATIKGRWRDGRLPNGSMTGYFTYRVSRAASPEKTTKLSVDGRLDPQKASISLDDDSEVVKRIKELKAAKEERQRSTFDLVRDTPLLDDAERLPPSPSQIEPPTTTQAAGQLAEAVRVKEYALVPVKNERENEIDTFFITKDMPNELSQREELGEIVRSMPLTNVSAKSREDFHQAAPHHTPALSLTNPRKNRTAHRESSPTKAESVRGNEQLRNHSSSSYYPTLTEDTRRSFDSVQASVNGFLQASRLSQKVTHYEGNRQIAFSEVGDPDGHAVFCCVGMGLTRYIMAFYHELATTLKLRLITPDRPGVGDSDPYPDALFKPPLSWPDDIQAICNHLNITSFSLLAHSAGAIYALATALRMPTQLRGKIHLLAPWIPPSQMSSVDQPANSSPIGVLTKSQRFLRIIPMPFLKLSNYSFFNPNNSIKPIHPKANSRLENGTVSPLSNGTTKKSSPTKFSREVSLDLEGVRSPRPPRLEDFPEMLDTNNMTAAVLAAGQSVEPLKRSDSKDIKDRQSRYDEALITATWSLATHKSNPAADLIVCLERHQPIGFRYVDVRNPNGVVIHHGSKDTRVPLENIKWLGKAWTDRGGRCEVRVLEGEGHGLMASAGVMASVLAEVNREWDAEVKS